MERRLGGSVRLEMGGVDMLVGGVCVCGSEIKEPCMKKNSPMREMKT